MPFVVGAIVLFAGVGWAVNSCSFEDTSPKPDIILVDEPPPPVVSNSGWDGSVRQVKHYLERALKDPKSYESMDWSKVIQMPDGTYVVRHKYRAKNSFGGYVIEEQVFTLNADGLVIAVAPFAQR